MRYLQYAMVLLIMKHGYKTASIIAMASIFAALTQSYWWLAALPVAGFVAFVKFIMKDVSWG